MKILSKACLTLAVSFLILHSIVPHFHEDGNHHVASTSITKNHQDGGLFHLLQEIFSINDPGSNHLEEYASTDVQDFDAFFPEEIRLTYYQRSTQEWLSATSSAVDISYPNIHTKRGPPAGIILS